MSSHRASARRIWPRWVEYWIASEPASTEAETETETEALAASYFAAQGVPAR